MAPVEYLDPNTSFKHWIASDLRFWREREELSLSQMGLIMGASRHTVSNIEHARDGWNMNEDHAARLDKHFNLNGHFSRLVHYARTAHDPDWFLEYAKFEFRALIIRTYRLALFPGLFQTPEYAHALVSATGAVKDVEAAVQDRMSRQEALTRDNPPDVRVVIDENVLHRPVGGSDIMRDQLKRLYEAATSPNVTVRVVRQSTGYYAGLNGSFNFLTMQNDDLAFVEAPGGGRLIKGSAEIRRFENRWERIGASALPWDASRELIAEAMERFS